MKHTTLAAAVFCAVLLPATEANASYVMISGNGFDSVTSAYLRPPGPTQVFPIEASDSASNTYVAFATSASLATGRFAVSADGALSYYYTSPRPGDVVFTRLDGASTSASFNDTLHIFGTSSNATTGYLVATLTGTASATPDSPTWSFSRTSLTLFDATNGTGVSNQVNNQFCAPWSPGYQACSATSQIGTVFSKTYKLAFTTTDALNSVSVQGGLVSEVYGGAHGNFTLQLGIELPTGYSFTSDSGAFLSAAPASAVPVPTAAWLFGSGLLGLVGIARRK